MKRVYETNPQTLDLTIRRRSNSRVALEYFSVLRDLITIMEVAMPVSTRLQREKEGVEVRGD